MSSEKSPPTLPLGSPGWDDEPTIVWAPPDWSEEEAPVRPPAPTKEREATEPRAPQYSVSEAEREPVEVEVRQIQNPTALRANSRRVYEVWTKNRVYSLDALMQCIEVIDLKSGRSDDKHPFIGARLVGGQLHGEESSELTFPLPLPGSEAVFQRDDSKKRIRLSLTSRVTRVIMHVQRVSVDVTQRDDAWGTITSVGRRPRR